MDGQKVVAIIAIVGVVILLLLWDVRRRAVLEAKSRHPRASAAQKAYAERFGTERKIVIPDDYREAEDKEVAAALTAQELYRLRTAQAKVARLHYVRTLHEQRDHSQCATDCPTVFSVSRELDVRESIRVVAQNVGDVTDGDLEALAGSISNEMKRRATAGES